MVTGINQEINIDIPGFSESQKNSMLSNLGQLEQRWDGVNGSFYRLDEVNDGKGIMEKIDINLSTQEYYDSLQSSGLYPLLAGRKVYRYCKC